MACNMSIASPERTSPTTMRSGLMRSALRTRSRMEASPAPSAFAGRHSSRKIWRPGSRSSAASSIVTTRSSAGMNAATALSNVVFPAPAPPLTMMLHRDCTAHSSNFATPGEQTSGNWIVRAPNLRMVSSGPSTESGGTTPLTREPSGSRASTIGDVRSMRKPSGATMRSRSA
ncbi:unannotated protein [freshwater metagenome]|uniref:Unannotated protein n=1 Tax=freshwater metagenome TaxID=449393 RepID=A0A6J7LHL7_9ZZZZ